MAAPQLVIGAYDAGQHNTMIDEARARLARLKPYEDQSTIILLPTRGVIPARTVECLANLATPMNQRAVRMFVTGAEVGSAYDEAVNMILEHPDLGSWTYLLTIEEDMLFPPDALLKLLEGIGPYSAIGGLYWTKGQHGQPMIYGDPAVLPVNFTPQMPVPDTVQECNGVAMGFTLYRLDDLRRVDAPRFKTVRSASEAWTQDLYYCHKAKQVGLRFAVHTGVLCGHLDPATGTVW